MLTKTEGVNRKINLQYTDFQLLTLNYSIKKTKEVFKMLHNY